jgi:hypothetical protein
LESPISQTASLPAEKCAQFPLELTLKLIASAGRLLSKADLRAVRINLRRHSTADVDESLGLSHFIHLYLPKEKQLRFDRLPILDTQLKQSSIPPFPHTVLAIPTNCMSDDQCGICNFNATVSRPAYAGVKGGDHAREMSPEKILRHWQGFRADNPDPKRLRFSQWHEGIAVPLLLGHQITLDPSKAC